MQTNGLGCKQKLLEKTVQYCLKTIKFYLKMLINTALTKKQRFSENKRISCLELHNFQIAVNICASFHDLILHIHTARTIFLRKTSEVLH